MGKRIAVLVVLGVAGCIPDLDRGLPGNDVGAEQGVPDSFVYASDILRPDTVLPLDLGDHLGDQGSGDTKSDPPPDGPSPDTFAGKWYQANRHECPALCAGKNLQNVNGPEGGKCMSGEVRPASGIAQGITFHWGCGNNPCSSSSSAVGAKSYGEECYRTGQKQDDDDTDFTVGCFCSP